MYKRTEAVVLNTQRFSEADLIVTYITKEFGILKTLAKSPRKIKSRFGSSLEPLTVARIAFFGKEQKSLPRLIQSDIIRTNQALRDNIDIFMAISDCVRLILYLFPERHREDALYHTFTDALEQFHNDNEIGKLSLAFKIKVLHLSGHAPALAVCGRCNSNTNRFYPSEGCLICPRCASAEDIYIEVPEEVKALYRFICSSSLHLIKRLKVQDEIWNKLEELIDAHLNYNIREGSEQWQKNHIMKTSLA